MLHIKDTLRDTTNKKAVLKREKIGLHKKLRKANDMYESALTDLLQVEEDLLTENWGNYIH